MTIRMAVDGIWREFADHADAVGFVFGDCLNCRAKCQGMFCRPCYRGLTPKQRTDLLDKKRGTIIGCSLLCVHQRRPGPRKRWIICGAEAVVLMGTARVPTCGECATNFPA